MKYRKTHRGSLAATATVIIALSGLFVSAPAFADDAPLDEIEVTSPAEDATSTPAEGESETPTDEATAPADEAAPAPTESEPEDAPVVALAAPAAPAITSPADGATYTAPVTAISGTGVPTADIAVEDADGVPLGTATVGVTGDWTVTGLNLGLGEHSIVVTQTFEAETSPVAAATFAVVPVAPAIVSIPDGAVFAYDAVPTNVSGTGVEGATVNVWIRGPGNDLGFTTTVENGAWFVDFGGLGYAGTFTIEANQVVDGATSASTITSFTTLRAPVGAGDGGDDDGAAAAPGDDVLAETGVDLVVPLVGTGLAIALLSGGLMLALRRRTPIEAAA